MSDQLASDAASHVADNAVCFPECTGTYEHLEKCGKHIRCNCFRPCWRHWGAMLFCQKVQSGGPDELPLSVEQTRMVPTGPVLITFPLFLPAGPTVVTHTTWNATKFLTDI